MKKTLFLFVMLCLAGIGRVGADTLLPPGKIETFGSASAFWRDGALMLRIDNPYPDPAIRLLPPEGMEKWDLSKGKAFAVDVENLSDTRQARFLLILKTPVGGKKGTFISGIALNPGEKRTLRFQLPHQWLYAAPQGTPGLCTIDTARITSIDFALHGWFEEAAPGLTNCRLSNFRLEGELIPEEAASPAHMKHLLPFIDLYGQYMHADWPEKIHSDADLTAAYLREKAELDASARPAEWNEYGGWKNGPRLEATGSFRTEKYQGKWYLVDPVGNLFFSQGMNVLIRHTDPVKIDGHEAWFVPEIRPHVFQSGGANYWQATDRSLQVKYGREDDTRDFYATLAKRLEHWGFNTVGDWGHPELIGLGKLPYTLELSDFDRSMPRLGTKFYDVYDPIYQRKMKNLIDVAAERNAAVRKSLTDPLCIGYFIDNELDFGNRRNFSFCRDVMTAPADKAVKKALVAELESKYHTVAALNKAWDSSYSDWNAVLEQKSVPENDAFRTDMEDFFGKTVELYFQLCRDAVKSAAPHRLYLGCRFLAHDATHPLLARLCGKYADVFSVNIYRHTPGNLRTGRMPDVPVLIGEFHFSASLPSRGRFSPDIVAGGDEEERAVAYLRYMQGALVHPNIVGAHWFQLRDQPLTGRSDGEGYQIGFVDIADTPYREMIRTSRDIGEHMYRYRLNGRYADRMQEKEQGK